jgi:hypothetical protein
MLLPFFQKRLKKQMALFACSSCPRWFYFSKKTKLVLAVHVPPAPLRWLSDKAVSNASSCLGFLRHGLMAICLLKKIKIKKTLHEPFPETQASATHPQSRPMGMEMG